MSTIEIIGRGCDGEYEIRCPNGHDMCYVDPQVVDDHERREWVTNQEWDDDGWSQCPKCGVRVRARIVFDIHSGRIP